MKDPIVAQLSGLPIIVQAWSSLRKSDATPGRLANPSASTPWVTDSGPAMTPFDAKSDNVIEEHLNDLGFTVNLGSAFEGCKAGSSVDLSPDQLFDLVVKTYRSFPISDAIYFQGATMNPLPIIQRLDFVGHRSVHQKYG